MGPVHTQQARSACTRTRQQRSAAAHGHNADALGRITCYRKEFAFAASPFWVKPEAQTQAVLSFLSFWGDWCSL
jgi:hypothetical protein